MTYFSIPHFDATARSSPTIQIGKAQAAAWLFGFLAALFLIWPLWRMGFPMELDRNEAWNAWFADAAALSRTKLYPSTDELIVNNYPPLSFFITALFSKLTGDTILAGRVISILSLFVACGASASCIYVLTGSRRASAFGGFWLLATMTHAFSRYVGMNDPSFLGLAVMAVGLVLFLERANAQRSVEPAIALMVVAGFVKHSLFAMPLAALIWLAFTNKREAAWAAAFGTVLCGTGLFLCETAFGPNFIDEMLMPRQLSFEHIFANVNKLQWIAPALIIWGLWVWPNRKQGPALFTLLLIGLTLISGLLQTSGAGVVFNAYFEVFFASAIGIALAFQNIGAIASAQRFRRGAVQTAVIVVLVLRLVLSQHTEPYSLLFSMDFRQESLRKSDVTVQEIAKVRAIPGFISCQTMTVCYRAGKAFVFDWFWVNERLATGVLSKVRLDASIAKDDIRFEGSPREAAW